MVVHLVLSHPGIMLHEIQAELLEETGADMSLSTICDRICENIPLVINAFITVRA